MTVAYVLEARRKMLEVGTPAWAVERFEDALKRLGSGASGVVLESEVEPLSVAPLPVGDARAHGAEGALATTAVLRLNGGLGTSMGLQSAKSLLQAKGGRSFLDLIAGQVLHLRHSQGVRLPVTFLNSFRTSRDTLRALTSHQGLGDPTLPLELLQTREPKVRARDYMVCSWPQDPDLEWCPPGHGELYEVMNTAGLVEDLLDEGFTQLFVANADNLGAVPTPEMADWFAGSGSPFTIESVRSTANDRKGGHFVRRRRDGRVVLRESAQVRYEDQAAASDVGRHQHCSTNNIWINVTALRDLLVAERGRLRLPLIKNVKTVDPSDPSSTQVVQLESAAGAAIEFFEGAQTVEVDRSRFVPVKTTDDLLVLQSDCYRLDEGLRLHQMAETIPYVSLSPSYRRIGDFVDRFPDGVPSLRRASSLTVSGDWRFGAGVSIVGDVELGPGSGTIPAGATLDGVRLDGA